MYFTDDVLVKMLWGFIGGLVLMLGWLIAYIWKDRKDVQREFNNEMASRIEIIDKILKITNESILSLKNSCNNLEFQITKFNGTIDKLIAHDEIIIEKIHEQEKSILLLKSTK